MTLHEKLDILIDGKEPRILKIFTNALSGEYDCKNIEGWENFTIDNFFYKPTKMWVYGNSSQPTVNTPTYTNGIFKFNFKMDVTNSYTAQLYTDVYLIY